LINENDVESYKLVTKTIKQDLLGSNEIYQSQALAMIGTQAPEELVSQVETIVKQLALNQSKYSLNIRKKAILCLVRIIRKFPSKYDSKAWGP